MTKEHVVTLSELRGEAENFLSYLQTLKTGKVILESRNLTDETKQPGATFLSEEYGESILIESILYGNNPTDIEKLREKIRNEAEFRKAANGLLDEDGRIEQHPVKPMGVFPKDQMHFISSEIHIFGNPNVFGDQEDLFDTDFED